MLKAVAVTGILFLDASDAASLKGSLSASSRGGAQLRHVEDPLPSQNVLTPEEEQIFNSSWDDVDVLIAEKPNRVMNAINVMRAKVCAHMRERRETRFAKNFLKCVKFMEKVCKPGSDHLMDGDDHEVSTGKGYCEAFFPEKKKEEKKDDKDSETKDKKKDEKEEKDEDDGEGTQKRIHQDMKVAEGGGLGGMDEKVGRPEQGYDGPLVTHDNKKTGTGDWLREFGPYRREDDSRDPREICKRYPENEWCRLHGYGPDADRPRPRRAVHSAASSFAGSAAALALATAAAASACA